MAPVVPASRFVASDSCLLARAGPVLVAAAARGARPPGDVADGDDAGHLGDQPGVGAHPVVDRQAGALEPAGVRRDADPDDDDVRRHRGPVDELDAGDATGVAGRHRHQPGHGRGGPQVRPVRGVQLDTRAGDPGSEGGRQGQWQTVEDRRLEPHRAARGCHLGTDEPRADDDHARAAVP